MNSYIDPVINHILANNNFRINAVSNFQEIATLIFRQDQYSKICSLIKEQNWDTIKKLHDDVVDFRQYLSISVFDDQCQLHYAVTTYDSDELWQDPEILDIFQL